jgi:conjugal transfer pilus assembly protein TraW
MTPRRWMSFILAILFSNMVEAKSLGTIGETFRVAEMSFLKFIELRLKVLMKAPSMQVIQDQWVDSIKNYAKAPPSLNLPRATHSYEFSYDPSLVLTRDIRDAEGRILYFKGTQINPLERLPFYHPHWLFLDADDLKALSYTAKLLKKFPDLKVILTRGEIEKTSNQLNCEVFFDQGGRLTQKLGIKEVPAFVQRISKVLRIQVGIE